MRQETARVTGTSSSKTPRIWYGDAFDPIREIDSTSVDLLLTSPPYWGLRSYGLEHSDEIHTRWLDSGGTPERVPPYDWYREAGGILGLEPYPEWFVVHLNEFSNKARRAIKSSGRLWVNLGTRTLRVGEASATIGDRDYGTDVLGGERLRGDSCMTSSY
jgi:DNA modification methylase